ncbi:MAG: hypothetical protein ACRD03_09045 [Acidimicrobiales bacterium]
MTALVMAATLVACSSGGDDEPAAPAGGSGSSSLPDRQPAAAEPVEEAPDGLGPMEPPPGFTKVTGEGFTLFAPERFTADRRTSSNGEPMLVLSADAPAGGEPPAGGPATTVAVARDVAAGAGVLEQSRALESSKRLVDEATGVRRTIVAWPGATHAVLVEWTVQEAAAPPSSGTQAVRTVQLGTDVAADLRFAVVATAPADSFDDSEVAAILRTFRPTKAATT